MATWFVTLQISFEKDNLCDIGNRVETITLQLKPRVASAFVHHLGKWHRWPGNFGQGHPLAVYLGPSCGESVL